MLEADEVAAAARERIVERRRGHRGAHAASRRRPRLRHLERPARLALLFSRGRLRVRTRSERMAGVPGRRSARCAARVLRACVPSSWWLAGCNASVQAEVGWMVASMPSALPSQPNRGDVPPSLHVRGPCHRSIAAARAAPRFCCMRYGVGGCMPTMHVSWVVLGLLPSCRTAPKQKLKPPGLVGAASAHTQRALLLRCAAPTHSRFLHRQYRRARR